MCAVFCGHGRNKAADLIFGSHGLIHGFLIHALSWELEE